MKHERIPGSNPALPPLCSPLDVERVLEFEFVRATEPLPRTASGKLLRRQLR